MQVNAPQELDVHDNIVRLGLSSKGPPVRAKYMVLGLCSHDSSQHAPKARTKYAHFWCDTTAKLSHRHPLQTQSSSAELFYLHHVRSSASSPRGASGTGSAPARAYWKSSTPQWLLDALEVAVPVAYKCLEVVVVSQLFPVT